MRLGIHHTKDSFSGQWIEYCKANAVDFKVVNCYSSDIIDQLADCDALMWHFSQNSSKDFLLARQLILSLEAGGKKVFPDSGTSWHFDDKLGQKYLLEAIGAPLPESWLFYDRTQALEWASRTDYPKVFKLRGGAGSQNVRLVKSEAHAKKLIKKAFGRGFSVYDPAGSLKERIRLYRLGKTNLRDILEGIARFIIKPAYAKAKGPERGYVYFQEFIGGNDHDIRIIIIGDKAFAIKRMVRTNDFRASGSGNIHYARDLFDEALIRLSFGYAKKLKSQCVAFDYIFKEGKPLIVEISYGFLPAAYVRCPGYWDINLKWHEGKFNPYYWMVEDLLESLHNPKWNNKPDPVKSV